MGVAIANELTIIFIDKYGKAEEIESIRPRITSTGTGSVSKVMVVFETYLL